MPTTRRNARAACASLARGAGTTPGDRLPRLKMPVSVFAGRHDAIATPQVQRGLAAHIPGAVFQDFAGGHLFFVQDPTAAPVIAAALGTSAAPGTPPGGALP